MLPWLRIYQPTPLHYLQMLYRSRKLRLWLVCPHLERFIKTSKAPGRYKLSQSTRKRRAMKRWWIYTNIHQRTARKQKTNVLKQIIKLYWDWKKVHRNAKNDYAPSSLINQKQVAPYIYLMFGSTAFVRGMRNTCSTLRYKNLGSIYITQFGEPREGSEHAGTTPRRNTITSKIIFCIRLNGAPHFYRLRRYLPREATTAV